MHKSPDDNFANPGRKLRATRAVRRGDGSAALDLCYVAAGRLDYSLVSASDSLAESVVSGSSAASGTGSGEGAGAMKRLS